MASGLEPTSGLGGGRRLLCGSAAGLRCPSGGPGKRGGPLGAENGLAAAERAPGGSAGGRAAPASGQEEERQGEGISNQRGPSSHSNTVLGHSCPSVRGRSAEQLAANLSAIWDLYHSS